jgi:putative PIN family toxin of toxin-antitoxin system
MHILADTNILISAVLFPNSITTRVWTHIIEHHHVTIPDHAITELKNVFQRKFPANTNELQHFLESLPCEIINLENFPYETIEIPFIRDKTDIPILTAAIAIDADILLTGDKDFLDIKLDKPLIMSPGAFMKSYMSNKTAS